MTHKAGRSRTRRLDPAAGASCFFGLPPADGRRQRRTGTGWAKQGNDYDQQQKRKDQGIGIDHGYTLPVRIIYVPASDFRSGRTSRDSAPVGDSTQIKCKVQFNTLRRHSHGQFHGLPACLPGRLHLRTQGERQGQDQPGDLHDTCYNLGDAGHKAHDPAAPGGALVEGRARSCLRHARRSVHAGRQTAGHPLRRHALSAGAARVLARPHAQDARPRPEHAGDVRLLESARAAAGKVRFQRQPRPGGVYPRSAKRRPLGAPPARSVHLLRVGFRRFSRLAAGVASNARAQHGSRVSESRVFVHGTRGEGNCRAADHARRSHPHGAGGERVRLLRQRS